MSFLFSPDTVPSQGRLVRESPELSSSMRVSVVIPALDEERSLPGLLRSLEAQTLRPVEIIVVDGGSTDSTASVARFSGAKVLRGGRPALSRNVGARVSSGDWLLFLDADVVLAPTAVAEIIQVAEDRNLAAASCWFVPDSSRLLIRLTHWFANHYFLLTSRLGWPHCIGGCLLARRSLHFQIGGFDTTVLVAEDQDYVTRFTRVGRYAFARTPVVQISARRFEREGTLKMSLKWVRVEAHRVFRGEVRHDRFRYFK